MGNSNGKIVFDKDSVEQATTILLDSRSELYDIDCLLYKAIMNMSYARGFDLVEAQAGGIDMRMPENMMIKLREDTEYIIKTITDASEIILNFSGSERDEKLKCIFVDDITSEQGGNVVQAVYAPPSVMGETVSGIVDVTPAVYAPPSVMGETVIGTVDVTPAVYAPPSVIGETVSGTVDVTPAVYAPPSVMSETVSGTVGVTPAVYAPPSVINEKGSSGTNPINTTTPPVTEYAPIPNTGVSRMGDSLSKYVMPATVGVVGGVIGTVASLVKKDNGQETNDEDENVVEN